MRETPETLMGITAALLESLLSPLELASKVEQAVQEAIEAVRQTLGTELEFDIFVMLDEQAVHYVMEPV